jgi:hypothetical protein
VSFDDVIDKAQTKYLFNRSSIKKFNKSYILKNYENYTNTLIDDSESDYNEIFIGNYNDCLGDSVPCDLNKAQLDMELDEIVCKKE